MPKFHVGQSAVRDTKGRKRAAGALGRTAVVAGALGLTAGAGLLTSGSALASGGLQPGNLVLKPASGAVSLKPTFATTDGCPAGYQGSAQVSMFTPKGTLISRISVVVPFPAAAFQGQLEGSIGALLKFANVPSGGTSQWAVGCYSGQGGTGSVTWVQYTVVKLSADGKSYSISSGNGQPATGSGSGQAVSNLYGKVAAPSKTGQAQSVAATTPSGGSAPVLAASVAGACGLGVALGGIAWYRRRNRPGLQ